MLVLLWILILGYFQQSNSGYIEIVEVTGCDTCKLLLTCRRLTSIIAIIRVSFQQDAANDTLAGNLNSTTVAFPPVPPRDILNQRCSGLNHCSFILSEDCPGSEIFGQGNITIKYACVTEDRIKKYCNSDIALPTGHTTSLSEGFIHNPGYPRFYSGQKDCLWRITAQPDQRIRLTILDISLIVDNAECNDVLEIRDTGQLIYSTCRQEYPPAEIVSGSESIEVVLSSKHLFNPRRGFLIHYSVLGCPELPVPQGAFLVYRSPYLTVFSCCAGYNFPETGARTKSIRCIGTYWNTSLPLLDCQKSSVPPLWNLTRGETRVKAANMASELIAPALLVLGLFILNFAVVFVIYKARRKQELNNLVRDEELSTFTSSPAET